MMVEMMEFIAKCTCEPKHYQDFFIPVKRQIIVNVGLTFLKTTAGERVKMVEDSDDFVHLALDTCDKQKSGIVKSQAAKILEGLCDNIEGSTSFMAVFTCKALTWALKGKPQVSTGDDLEVLMPFLDSYMMANFQPEDIADVCMLALTMVSYIIPKRADLVMIFDQSLSQNFDIITSTENILLRSRMCLLLGYYADMIFMPSVNADNTQQNNRFRATMKFLVESMALTGREASIAKQAADTMHTVVSD
jgi:hypothetical protein